MTKDELKRKVCEAIDARAKELIDFGEDIRRNPELGYKEFHAAAQVEAKFSALGLDFEKNIAVTGLKARLKGKSEGPSVSVIGEMDSVLAPGHPFADPKTGAAHSCGHNGQLTAMLGAGMGLVDAGAMEHLAGDVVLLSMPAEECVEIEWRNSLRDEGKIQFLGGKQQFVVEGAFDDIDMVLSVHHHTELGKTFGVGGSSNGFLAKYVKYRGKEAHSGAAPDDGVNAMNAALLGLLGIHAQRETLRDSDMVRIHPIITKGGDLVNTVPADVRIEMFIRARTIEAVLDANIKVDRALQAGAMTVGGGVDIINVPGYLPKLVSPEFNDLLESSARWLADGEIQEAGGHTTASTDLGDLSHIMPVAGFSVGGVSGIGHSENYVITDPESYYITPSKLFAIALIDLLWDDAAGAKQIISAYKAPYDIKGWLEMWNELSTTKTFG